MSRLTPVLLRFLALGIVATSLGGCSLFGMQFAMRNMSEKECLMRAMYFESNRSSAEGMLAVGTVVMNRRDDPRYPKTICGVVGQKNQFAPGVLTKPMTDSGAVLAAQMSEEVLRGNRHPGVQRAQHFHTAGLRF